MSGDGVSSKMAKYPPREMQCFVASQIDHAFAGDVVKWAKQP